MNFITIFSYALFAGLFYYILLYFNNEYYKTNDLTVVYLGVIALLLIDLAVPLTLVAISILFILLILSFVASINAIREGFRATSQFFHSLNYYD